MITPMAAIVLNTYDVASTTRSSLWVCSSLLSQSFHEEERRLGILRLSELKSKFIWSRILCYLLLYFVWFFIFSSTILKNIHSCLTVYWLPVETREAVYWILEIFSTNDLGGGRIQCVCVCVWLVKEKNKRELNKNFANLYLSLKL